MAITVNHLKKTLEQFYAAFFPGSDPNTLHPGMLRIETEEDMAIMSQQGNINQEGEDIAYTPQEVLIFFKKNEHTLSAKSFHQLWEQILITTLPMLDFQSQNNFPDSLVESQRTQISENDGSIYRANGFIGYELKQAYGLTRAKQAGDGTLSGINRVQTSINLFDSYQQNPQLEKDTVFGQLASILVAIQNAYMSLAKIEDCQKELIELKSQINEEQKSTLEQEIATHIKVVLNVMPELIDMLSQLAPKLGNHFHQTAGTQLHVANQPFQTSAHMSADHLEDFEAAMKHGLSTFIKPAKFSLKTAVKHPQSTALKLSKTFSKLNPENAKKKERKRKARNQGPSRITTKCF